MHISADRAQIYLRHKSSFVNKILYYNITLKKAHEINNNINNSNKQIKFCVNVRTQIHVRLLRHLLSYTYL